MEYDFLRVFLDYCVNREKEVTKFLYSMCLENDVYLDEIFSICCHRGDFDLVKYMFDERIDSSHGFYQSCVTGNLEIAKWLHSKNVIDMEKDEWYNKMLDEAGENGHHDVVEWLESLID